MAPKFVSYAEATTLPPQNGGDDDEGKGGLNWVTIVFIVIMALIALVCIFRCLSRMGRRGSRRSGGGGVGCDGDCDIACDSD